MPPCFPLPLPWCTAAGLGDSNVPLNKIVRILNNQLQALGQVDARTDELSAALSTLNRDK